MNNYIKMIGYKGKHISLNNVVIVLPHVLF
jgi:hypothetical protein